MNMNVKLIVPAVLAAVALTACSSGSKAKPEVKAAPTAQQQAQAQQAQAPVPNTLKVDSIDGTKEVHYKCGKDGKEPLSVMYGFKGNEVVAAQVKYKGQVTENLFRITDSSKDVNAFWGGNVAWIAEAATAANVDKVDGNMLTIRGTTEVNGKQEVVDQIATRFCALDKGAKAAAKPAAKKVKK
ncbi:MAG: hypothetical protein E7J15_02795 [Neisseria sp.]|uniref:hypothetical protein n=1 Tax=uncultured Neisseria sp. TaxID=237778 RepID=UPI00261020F1|nr:hypothetical protein [uncultured Neisseria sp.]MDU8022687.1 hypothetical protein [Neisseria sp.]